MFKNVKLATKLNFGFLFVALLGCAVGLYSIYEYRQAAHRQDTLYLEMLIPLHHMGEVLSKFHAIRADLEVMIDPDSGRSEIEAAGNRIAERRASITAHQKEVEKAIVEESEKALLAVYNAERGKYGPVLERAMERARAGDRAGARALVRGELETLRVSYQGSIERLFQRWVTEAAETDETTDATARSTQKIVFSLLAFSLVLSIVLGRLITSDIRREVGGEPFRIRAFAETIAGGDLTMKSREDSRVTGINLAVGKLNTALQGLIIPMTSNMTGLAAAAEQVGAVAGEIRRSTGESAEKTASVAAAAEEMHSNMNSVAASVEQTTANVHAVASATEELTATIMEVAKRANRTREISEGAVVTAQTTGEIIDELAEAADQIGKVTDTINGISDQTKLLALNATIEAARAGEAGKGFAVVANEIKELARQAASATGDISNRVDAIRNATVRTKSGITDISGVINEVNDAILTIASAVEEQAITVQDISRNAGEVSAAVNDSAKMVAQSSTAASMVARDAAVLSAETRALEDSTRQLDQSSGSLRNMAREMQGLVSKFKV